MQFLSAASAWFAVSLPVIALMYMLKKRYTDTLVPSHLLWNRLLREQEANRPWQRLRSRLLLILQLLAALIAVLALMQPVLVGPHASDGHAVLLIDRSGSMSASMNSADEPTATRLSESINAINDWLDKQPNDKPISIVITGAEPEVLASREKDHRLLREKLEGIIPFYGRSDNAAALSFADSLHGGDKEGTTVLITDGNWIDAAEASAISLAAPIERLVPSQVDEDASFENGSILSLGLREDTRSPEHQYASVTVRNDSHRSRTYAVDIYAYNSNGDEIFRTDLTLEADAGDWQSAESKRLPPADYYKAVLRGSPDRVAADNTAYQFPQSPRTGRALLVTEGNLFLEKALALAGVQIVKSSPEQPAPEGELARDLDFVIIDGHYERLQTLPEWSEWLQNMPLWIIDHPVEGDSRTVVPANVEAKTTEHPVTEYLTFEDTHIGRFLQPEASEVAWGEPIVQYGGQTAIYAGSKQGRPQLRFTFNLQDSDLPLRPEFPILILHASEWMNGADLAQLGAGIAGSPMQIALQTDTVQAEWKLVDDGGLPPQEYEAAIAASTVRLNEELNRIPSVPGLYRLEERDGAGELIAARLLAVYPELTELESLRPDNENRPALTMGQTTGTPDEVGDIHPEQKQTQYSLIGWAAALLLLLIVSEWEVYRRGHIS